MIRSFVQLFYSLFAELTNKFLAESVEEFVVRLLLLLTRAQQYVNLLWKVPLLDTVLF
jgi:hypothetical protein